MIGDLGGKQWTFSTSGTPARRTSRGVVSPARYGWQVRLDGQTGILQDGARVDVGTHARLEARVRGFDRLRRPIFFGHRSHAHLRDDRSLSL